MSLWRRELVELTIGQAATPDASPRASAQRVDALLAQFEQALDASAVARGARLRCVIGGEAVRYAVVPWHDELSSPSLRLRLAEQCMRETYGDVASQWSVCHHGERYGAAALACAIERALIERLDAAARARGSTVASIEPSLTHAFNRMRHGIADELGWFVLQEPQGTTVLLVSPAEPLLVKRLAAAGSALAGALDREWFALGIEAERCPVYLPRAGAQTAPAALPGWRVVELAA